MSKIKFFVHKTNIDKKVANAISKYIKKNTDKPILLLVSGGSVLKILDYIDFPVVGKNINISLVDDRFSRNPNISNFLQLKHTEFYRKAKACKIKFISSLPKEGESLMAVSDRWEKELRQWESTYSSKRVVIAIMGVGLDGHTAGIMPSIKDKDKFSSLFENKEKWIVGYDAGSKNKYPLRITTSISFLRDIVDYAFVYVSGENKKNILKTIMKSDRLAKYPAVIFNSIKSVKLYTDIDI
jgi:6-phosphogluconolactonase/glucosamine-6-phosphate isomerase/deaminase